jgi:RNA polymerase sigma factor (sigma-70 family)
VIVAAFGEYLALVERHSSSCKMTPDDQADTLLVRRVLDGDDAAFTQLTSRHKKWLYRFIRRYVGHDADAFDLLQESFISAWSSLDRYDPERPFHAWLRQIALNKCRDRGRREKVRSIIRRLSSDSEQFAARGRWANPEAAISSREALLRLDDAIASLPARLREPLILTVFEELSHREVAQMLGVSDKAVETRVYRAKQRLSKVIEHVDLQDFSEDSES